MGSAIAPVAGSGSCPACTAMVSKRISGSPLQLCLETLEVDVAARENHDDIRAAIEADPSREQGSHAGSRRRLYHQLRISKHIPHRCDDLVVAYQHNVFDEALHDVEVELA